MFDDHYKPPKWILILSYILIVAILCTGTSALFAKYGIYCGGDAMFCLPTLGSDTLIMGEWIRAWGARQIVGAVPFISAIIYKEKIVWKVAWFCFLTRGALWEVAVVARKALDSVTRRRQS